MSVTKIRSLKDFLKAYPVISKVPVKWGDMDSFSHVNNTVYFKYQEEARLNFFAVLMSHMDPKLFDVEGFNNAKGVGPILSETYCKFKFPMKYPDKILVGSTIMQGDIFTDRYKLSHAIWSLKNEVVVSEGFGTVVNYNYNLKKSEPMSPLMISAIDTTLKGSSLPFEEKFKNSSKRLMA